MSNVEKMVKVTNRARGRVSYAIPEDNILRTFNVNETKEISEKEIQKLQYIQGGDVMLKNYLRIEDTKVISKILNEVEPEYHYGPKEIEKLLKTGTLDELEDCINFAPNGVLDLLKDIAVKIEVNDISKREKILELTGFNVTACIENNKPETPEEVKTTKARKTKKEETAPVEEVKKTRKATSKTKEEGV